MGNKRIVFISNLEHPLHTGLIGEVVKEVTSINDRIPKADIYICEGGYIKPLLLQNIRKINIGAKIITLFSDPRLYYLEKGIRFNLKKNKLEKYPLWRKIVASKLLNQLDGAIFIGEFSEEIFKKLTKNKIPSMNIPGYVSERTSQRLKKAKVNSNTHNILFIGHGPDYYVKGIEPMIESFKEIQKEYINANLYILGKWEGIKDKWKGPGIHWEGTQDIIKYIEKSSLSIHLGRGESFGINILETMLAGIPTICSADTGAKEVVGKVDPNWIIAMEKEKIVKTIKEYFEESLNKKDELRERVKEVANQYGERKIKKIFKEKYNNFIQKFL
jgi:glycosyltransferase involved in cell wall biosynthesis